jgi:NADPH-dependent ferric siderophore reductase
MTEAQTLFNELAARYGGVAALSPIETRIIAAIVKAVTALQAADPSAAPKISAAIEKLTAHLPVRVIAGEGGELDLSMLNDPELNELERLLAKAGGKQFDDRQRERRAAEAAAAGERVIARLQEMAEHEEMLEGSGERRSDLVFVAANASRVELTSHILVLDRKIAKQREEITALTKLNEALEMRLGLDEAAA